MPVTDDRKWSLYKSAILPDMRLLIQVMVLGLLVSCTGKDEFSTGDNFIDDKTRLAVVDTFKVSLSTVLMDSISTSGTGIALVGSYRDECFGSVTSVGYMEPGYKALNFDGTEIFDSAAVALVYSGYSYGDTTALMSLGVYQLLENMTLNDNVNMYSAARFDYSETPLGSKVFYPEPNSTDTLFIPVNSFGKQIFEMFEEENVDVSSSDLFLKYVRGYVIKSDSGNTVVGFKADAAQTFLKIYFHVNGETVTESSVSIPFGPTTRQFNSVQSDFTGSELAGIKTGCLETVSEDIGEKAFLQGMVGLLPKIRFPSLQDITLENRWKILKAELVIEPVMQSYNLFELPDQLCFYITDKYNRVGSVLTDDSENVIYSFLETDELFNEDTSYTFDITSYINGKLADSYFDSEDGLFIGLSQGNLNKTLDRLLIEGRNPGLKLRLYYLTY